MNVIVQLNIPVLTYSLECTRYLHHVTGATWHEGMVCDHIFDTRTVGMSGSASEKYVFVNPHETLCKCDLKRVLADIYTERTLNHRRMDFRNTEGIQ